MNEHTNTPSTGGADSEILVRCEHVSKKFCKSLKRSLWYGVKDIASELNPFGGQTTDCRPQTADSLEGLQSAVSSQQSDPHSLQSSVSGLQSLPPLRKDEFWAVKDVSFELRRGECLGLIGRNGAGKTTLLRMLTGLIKPDQGRITMRGRVGALIALGAGFNPLLTGRENIYVNGSVLGLTTREIEAKLEEIIDFADIRDFIDAPVQSYSSGMSVRLGFAVAAVLIQPDILLLDEVLAVGDIGFRIKCLNTVRQMASQSAVVFVSHSMEFVSQFCTRVVVMAKGAVVCDTPSVAEGIDCYFSEFPAASTVAGSGDAVISNVRLKSGQRSWQGEEDEAVAQGEDLSISFDVEALHMTGRSARLTVQIVDHGANPVIFIVSSQSWSLSRDESPKLYHARIDLGKIDLNAGRYSMVISAEEVETSIRLARVQGVGRFRVTSNLVHWARIVRHGDFSLQP